MIPWSRTTDGGFTFTNDNFSISFFFSRNQLWTVMEWRSRNRLTPSLSKVWGNPDRHIWPDFNVVSTVNFDSISLNFCGLFTRWIFVAFLPWNFYNISSKILTPHTFGLKSMLGSCLMGLFFLQCNDAPWNITVCLKLVSRVDTK